MAIGVGHGQTAAATDDPPTDPPASIRCGVFLLTPRVRTGATEAGDHPHGRSLADLVTGKTTAHDREWAIYGEWGSGVCVTDGQHTYMRPCDPDRPANTHSASMINARGIFLPPTPKADAEAGEFLPYADVPVWRFDGEAVQRHDEALLFDTDADPGQAENLVGKRPDLEGRMKDLLGEAFETLSVPQSFERRVGVADVGN